MKQTWISMQCLDAARMSEAGPIYNCHYVGQVFTWKSRVAKKKKKVEINKTDENASD